MPNNQFLTVADVYNPIETEMKIQQLNAGKMRNRIDAMKMREMYQQQRRRNRWDTVANDPRGLFHPVSGQFASQGSPVAQTQTAQPMQPQQARPMPPAPPPQLSDEDRAAIRGQKILKSVIQASQPLIQRAKTDPAARVQVNKIAQTLDDNTDYQTFVHKTGFIKTKYVMDEETGEGTHALTKDWSKADLEHYAENAPNGQVLAPLAKHPGKYTINFNDLGVITGYEMVSDEPRGMLGDKTLTENEIIARAMYGDKEAVQWMDAKIAFERRKTGAKFGELTDAALDLYADKILVDPKYIAKFPSRGPQRVQLANRIQKKATEKGLIVPDIELKNAKFNAVVKSYNKQKAGFDADRKIAEEFYTDVRRLRPQLARIRTNYPALFHKSRRQLMKIMATPGLGPEAVFAQELDAIMSQFIRMSRDASSTISELSVGAQQAMEKLMNKDNPAFVIEQQIDKYEISTQERIGARGRALAMQEAEIKEHATFKKRIPATPSKPSAPTTPLKIGRFTVEVE